MAAISERAPPAASQVSACTPPHSGRRRSVTAAVAHAACLVTPSESNAVRRGWRVCPPRLRRRYSRPALWAVPKQPGALVTHRMPARHHLASRRLSAVAASPRRDAAWVARARAPPTGRPRRAVRLRVRRRRNIRRCRILRRLQLHHGMAVWHRHRRDRPVSSCGGGRSCPHCRYRRGLPRHRAVGLRCHPRDHQAQCLVRLRLCQHLLHFTRARCTKRKGR
jgi:hypothetical protein